MGNSISKPINDPSRKAPAPPSKDFKISPLNPGTHTVSVSKCGTKKMVVVVGKGISTTHHLHKINGNWSKPVK